MIERLRARWQAWWLARLVWIAADRRALGTQALADWALVAIIGREHYRERRKLYPIRSWREVATVAALECPEGRATITYIGPWQDDHREVTFFELEPAFVASEQKSLLWVPESVLVAEGLEPFGVADVERDGLRYFCSRAGASQLCGGLIRSPQSYALGVGIPTDVPPVRIDESALLESLAQRVQRVPLSNWARSLRPGVGAQALEWLRPASLAVTASALLYLLLVSAYLVGAQRWREYQIARMGPEVGTLLQMQRRVDASGREATLLANVLQSKNETYRIWELAGLVWRGGGVLSSLLLLDREITLRGSTPVATDLLSALSKLPGFEGAKFAAPVRQAGNREEFTIVIQLRASTPSKSTQQKSTAEQSK